MAKIKSKYYEIVARVIEERREQIAVSPAWIATEVMAEIEPDLDQIRPAYEMSHAHLRHVARELCRGKFEENDSNEDQHDLFPDLQTRYPVKCARDEEPTYVVLEQLTLEDGNHNVERLFKESRKKMKHARALRAFLDQKFGRRDAA